MGVTKELLLVGHCNIDEQVMGKTCKRQCLSYSGLNRERRRTRRKGERESSEQVDWRIGHSTGSSSQHNAEFRATHEG